MAKLSEQYLVLNTLIKYTLDVEEPLLTCPENIETFASDWGPTMAVEWELPVYSDNSNQV